MRSRRELVRISALLCALFASSSCATSACPIRLQPPCSCLSSRFESISIVCDKGSSLNEVLQSLATPPALIDSLTISNTPIEELPPYAFNTLTVRNLILRNNGLQQIAPDAFAGPMLNSLESLEIRSNHLTAIPQIGVNEIRSLKSFSLYDNLISIVENNAFLSYHSRTKLTKLDLSANNMSVIFPQGLLGLEALEQLSLDKNRLRMIPEDALQLVPTLEQLSLGVNEIETIGVKALQLPNLKSISLEVNKIKSIPPDALQTVPNLAYLYLAGNLFTSIESTMFFYVNRLKVLSMSNNHDLRIVTASAFQYIPNLLRLELSDCAISVIEPTAFHKIPKVQVINLARNHLTHIVHDTFTALPSIISTIDDFSFSQLSALSTLDLSTNRLESLQPNVFYHSLNANTGRQRILKWLRENPDVEVAKSLDELAKCWTPSEVSGYDLRQEDPFDSTTTLSTVTTKSVEPGEKMRKLIKTPPVTATSIVDFPPVQVGTEPPKVSTMSLTILILGCVFGIIALVVILIVMIRCIMKSRGEKSTGSRFGGDSVASSAFSGSAYSSTGLYQPEQCQPIPRLRPRPVQNSDNFLMD
ncbi:lron-1 [Pristionchus pacificus]|nr:lron-1 [Pristionchus pacificus]